MSSTEIAGLVLALLVVGIGAGSTAMFVVLLHLDDRVQQAVTAALESPDLGQVRLSNLIVDVTVKEDDASVISSISLRASGPELSTKWIEHWLDEHDLVVAPKGKVFDAPRRTAP